MKAVDFYTLPRAIQDRFVGSVMSGFPPAPILASKGGTSTKLRWVGVSAASFVALLVTARIAFGDLESTLSLHSAKVIPLYFVFVFGLGFGLLQAFARVVRERALPYSAGIYLFPACLIDARHDQFKVYETRDLTAVELQGTSIRIAFAGGHSFLFPLSSPSQGPDLVKEVQTARDRAMHANATEDPKELVAVDPLHNPRFASPVGPTEQYELRRPPWKKLGPVIAAGIAIVLGPTIWALRNRGSDNKMYARATQVNDTPTYRLYMLHGSRHQEEVGEILLPRAELVDAKVSGNVDPLLKYKAEHPRSKIANEMNAAIRTAMLAALERAKQPGTLAALEEFNKRYPEHGIEPEYRAAVHAVYARELEAYKKKAPSKDKAAIAFIERLFAWAEKNGPKVEVRFKRKANTSLERADQFILKTPTFMGVVTYPSRFFDDKHSTTREATLGKSLAAQFDAGLAPELFEVTMGSVVTEPELPEPKVPTLFITHSAEWSGHNYTSSRPRGSYVGLNFNMDASFVIPGDAKPYKFKAEIFRHAATHVLHGDGTPYLGPGEAEEKVYETMATEAFDQFGKRLLAGFFTPEGKK
ncbi:MAG: hypothetical protein KIT84_38660 [Labilithrix sp.]|nr:hypothetical protein [Labilithrix sp.]MCW5816983.1 hypothetical protein [Labilithrix sp.]